MGNSIKITYLLNEEGQKKALALGKDAKKVQTIHVDPEHELFNDFLRLATVESDGTAWLLAGFRLLYNTKALYYNDCRDFTFSDIPTIEDIWQAILEADTRVKTEEENAKIQNEENAYDRATSNCHSKEKQIKHCKKYLEREYKPRATEIESHLAKTEKEYEAQKAQEEKEKEEERLEAEQELKAEQEAQEQYRRDKIQWIEEHGSERLKRCIAEDIECEGIYRSERLLKERPGWLYTYRIEQNYEIEYKEVCNPDESVFELLDEARKFDKEARLEYWIIEEKANEYNFHEDKVHTRAVVAVAYFLGKEIVFGLSEYGL